MMTTQCRTSGWYRSPPQTLWLEDLDKGWNFRSKEICWCLWVRSLKFSPSEMSFKYRYHYCFLEPFFCTACAAKTQVRNVRKSPGSRPSWSLDGCCQGKKMASTVQSSRSRTNFEVRCRWLVNFVDAHHVFRLSAESACQLQVQPARGRLFTRHVKTGRTTICGQMTASTLAECLVL